MKFCKNLQRVVDISDPEWAPHWPNYKMLKKLIKELPSLVPSDDNKGEGLPKVTPSSSDQARGQQHGDTTTEETDAKSTRNSKDSSEPSQSDKFSQNGASSMSKSPGEIAFFKLLHSEFKKASHFFDRASEEFTIREERVREGMNIIRQPNSIMVNEKWSLMAKSIYRLYKDLLLLETFAIMTYCSFSKILKKHDKVTGYETRIAFMSNVVNRANFTNYPNLLAMIGRCERLYEEVSQNLLREGKEGLYEDERLFINMIHRLNEQVLSNGPVEEKDRTEARKRAPPLGPISPSQKESPATSTLRSIIEENQIEESAKSDIKAAEKSTQKEPDHELNDRPAIDTRTEMQAPQSGQESQAACKLRLIIEDSERTNAPVTVVDVSQEASQSGGKRILTSENETIGQSPKKQRVDR